MNTGRMIRAGVSTIGVALGVIAIAGCNNADLTNVWQDPGYHGAPMRSVLVVSQKSDDVSRRLWEDAIAAQLEKQGVDAVSSYEVFPDGVPSQSRMEEALEDKNLDGAIVIKSLPANVESRWVPGWTTVEPSTYYNPWRETAVTVYRERRHPGYRVTDRYQRAQITVWSPEDGGKMIWAGTAELANPTSRDELRHDIAGGVVPGMKKAGLI